jgi:hypothetical protein
MGAGPSFASVCIVAGGLGLALVVASRAETPTPRLIVEAPGAEQLARGVAFIPYRTENLKIAPVFGPVVEDGSPRVGHLHVSVDGAGWRWADVSGSPVIVQGLSPGPHTVLIELADTSHRILDRHLVRLEIPQPAPGR